MKVRLSHQIILAALFKLLLNIGRRFVYPFAPALSRGLDVPLTAITSIIATTQITSLAGLFSGPLADQVGYRFIMRAGLFILAIGMFICGLAPIYWIVFLGLVLASFGKILFDPALQAFTGKKVEYARRARAIGITEVSWAGSTLVRIPLLGLVIEYFGLHSGFYLLALLGFAAWFVSGKVFPADEPQKSSGPAAKQMLLALAELIKVRPALGMLAFGFWISLANDNLFVIYGAWFERDFNVSLVSLGFSTVAIGSAELLGEFLTASFADKLGLKKAIIIGLVFASLAYFLLPFLGVSLAFAMVRLYHRR